MSGYSGEAAEQVVRMSLEGAEMAVRLTGSGAKQLAILLYTVLKDQKKSSGRTRLTNLLRSGKELKVFAVRDQDLRKFCAEAKYYGVLYTVLKDRDARDGLTDIMVRAEDAGKVNRIFERFGLATVDIGSMKAEIGPDREEKARGGDAPPGERVMTHKEKLEAFLDQALGHDPSGEEQKPQDPREGRTVRSRQSGPSSGRRSPTERDASADPGEKPSVKRQLEEIRKEQGKTAEASEKGRSRQAQEHQPPKRKRGRNKTEERA